MMTEADLRKRPEFATLPFYSDSDDRCEQLERPNDPQYDGTIHEAEDEVHFWQLLQDTRLEPKGAIKYSENDVRAIFWRKR